MHVHSKMKENTSGNDSSKQGEVNSNKGHLHLKSLCISVIVGLLAYFIAFGKLYNQLTNEFALKLWLGGTSKIEYVEEMPASYEFYKIRGMIDNFATNEEIQVIINLLENESLIKQNTGDELYGFNIETMRASNSVDEGSKRVFNRLRHRMLDAVRDHFNDTNIWIEYTHLTKRKPGYSLYSHGLHADNCKFLSFNQPCVFAEEVMFVISMYKHFP